jgi:acyl-[acyl-carrier-protein] desaturase
VTLVGDTITEEALPTYESWLMDVEGIDNVETVGQNGLDNGRVRKIVSDLLNKYLYLSGRVNMREVEMTTQHLLVMVLTLTGRDPYIQVFRACDLCFS